jgi:hypothetical protein
LAKFQPELAACVAVPVFTSSLLLVPLVHRMLSPGRRVGILTVDADSLIPEHLRAAGIPPELPVAIAGLETEKEFTQGSLPPVTDGRGRPARGDPAGRRRDRGPRAAAPP